MSNRTISLVIAFVFLCIFGGAYVWITSNESLMWSLRRGSIDKRTSSEAPYEIALRTSLWQQIPFPEGGPPKEWILNMPGNFVRSEIGENGDVQIKNGGSTDGDFIVRMAANVANDGKGFTPMLGQI